MKLYPIKKRNSFDNVSEKGSILADNFDAAKRSFAMEIYEGLLNGKYGDNFNYIDDYIVEDEALQTPDWYEEPGVYDFNLLPPELVLADSQLSEGIERFDDDGNVYTIVDESVNAYINQ